MAYSDLHNYSYSLGSCFDHDDDDYYSYPNSWESPNKFSFVRPASRPQATSREAVTDLTARIENLSTKASTLAGELETHSAAPRGASPQSNRRPRQPAPPRRRESSPAYELLCYQCGEPGHFARECHRHGDWGSAAEPVPDNDIMQDTTASYGESGQGRYFYHYTTQEAAEAIRDSDWILPSTDTVQDATMGLGVYLTDLPPHTKTEVLLWNNYGCASVDRSRVDFYVRIPKFKLPNAKKMSDPSRMVYVVPGDYGIDLLTKRCKFGQRTPTRRY